MVIEIATNYYYRLYYNYFLLRIEEVRIREEMKSDRRRRVKSQRPIGTEAVRRGASLKKKLFVAREKRGEKDIVFGMTGSISETRISSIKEEVSKMQKELESQRNALADLRKKKSKKNEMSKKEVEAKDEDDEFKVAVLDVGMATVKVL